MQDFIENQEFYANLFKGYAIMPEDDVKKNIEQLGTKYKTTSWVSFASHLRRMKSTLEESTLSPKRRIWVLESLDTQISEYDFYQNIPERRPYINEGDRDELKHRRFVLANGGFFNDEEDLWKERQAKGEVANWEELRAQAIVAIDAKLQMMDVKLTRRPASTGLETQMPTNNEVLSKNDTSTALNSLFKLNFTVTHCDELMRKVYVGPGILPQPHLSAKIWALLSVLKEKNLLNRQCTKAMAAEMLGNHFGYKMAAKPSGVEDSGAYQDARLILLTQVENDMINKKYGPNRA